MPANCAILDGRPGGRLLQRGTDKPTDRRPSCFHHLTFYGLWSVFFRRHLRSATLYHYLFAALRPPYAWWDLPVRAGPRLGGIGLLIGPIGLLHREVEGAIRSWSTRRKMGHGIVAFIAMLFLTSLTGPSRLLLLREKTARDGARFARTASRPWVFSPVRDQCPMASSSMASIVYVALGALMARERAR